MDSSGKTIGVVLVLVLSGLNSALASVDSISANGINSVSVPYTGDGVSIGQVELQRPGKPNFDDPTNSSPGTLPTEVFLLDGRVGPTADSQIEIYDLMNPQQPDAHATQVASVIISNDVIAPGVAREADLYATAGRFDNGQGLSPEDSLAISTQYIATRDSGEVRAINLSFVGNLPMGTNADGNAPYSQFIDWSASEHDVLYLAAWRNSTSSTLADTPADNFNGITVAASERVGDVFRKFSGVNALQLPQGVDLPDRRFIDLIAPGANLTISDVGGGTVATSTDGTSFATPHVTGTVALLQEHAEERIAEHAVNPANAPNWGGVVNMIPSAHRHQVMKAVLMNSADKIEDTSNNGQYLGMERTVVKRLKPGQTAGQEDDWFDSTAFMEFDEEFEEFFLDTDTPLDEELGTGHLNAKRALQQFIPGEHDFNGNFGTPIVGDVPLIGWDYGTLATGFSPINKYALDTPLEAGNFISATLAWDREVEFANDANSDGNFDEGDTFQDYTDLDDVLADLDLYLVPAGTGDVGEDDIAISASEVFPVEHIFTEIPFDGDYEIWVFRPGQSTTPATDYGLAWWYGLAPDIAAPNPDGDFDSDGDVDADDLSQWKGDFGANGDSDADNDGDSDGADFLAWQRNFTGPGAIAASTAVPEASSLTLFLLGLPVLFGRTRRDSSISFLSNG